MNTDKAERGRTDAEQARQQQELSRQSSELIRVAAEQARIEAEEFRRAAAEELGGTVATLRTLVERMEVVEAMRRAASRKETSQ